MCVLLMAMATITMHLLTMSSSNLRYDFIIFVIAYLPGIRKWFVALLF